MPSCGFSRRRAALPRLLGAWCSASSTVSSCLTLMFPNVLKDIVYKVLKISCHRRGGIPLSGTTARVAPQDCLSLEGTDKGRTRMRNLLWIPLLVALETFGVGMADAQMQRLQQVEVAAPGPHCLTKDQMVQPTDPTC